MTPAHGETIEESALSSIFGIEMEQPIQKKKRAVSKKKEKLKKSKRTQKKPKN